MSHVKGKDTKPEILVRSLVHKLGYRFRKHKSDLPGKPDIVLPKHRKVIFVHGCFWHGHNKCTRSSRPSSNKSFWKKKLDTNITRDKRNIHNLKSQGWEVLIIWSCEIRNTEKLINKISKFLTKNEGERNV